MGQALVSGLIYRSDYRLNQHPTDPTGNTAMAQDDDAPPRKPTRLEKLTLDTLGINELREYIAELREEIARVEADIARKQSHRGAAEAFFRRP
jgi:uncharacterized small protein (DUF1192 family)